MWKWLNNAYDNVLDWLLARGFSVHTYSNSLHLYLSMMLIVVLVLSGVNVYIAGTSVLIIGILKELFDHFVRGKEFSWWDIMYDCLGIFFGLLFCAGIRCA